MKQNEDLLQEVERARKYVSLRTAEQEDASAKPLLTTLEVIAECGGILFRTGNAVESIICTKAAAEEIEIAVPGEYVKREISEIILDPGEAEPRPLKGLLNVKLENAWITLSGELQTEASRRSTLVCIGIKGK